MEIPPNFFDRRTPSEHTIRALSHDHAEETKEDVMQNQRYRGSRWRAVATLVLLVFAVTLGRVAVGQNQNKAQTLSAERTQTKVVLLGTGTPRPYPDRPGAATAIVVSERVYLVDVGPGVVRRAAEKGMPELESTNLKVAFSPICIPTTPRVIRVYSSLNWFRFL